MKHDASDVLRGLLRSELTFSPTTLNGLTNHLSMALVGKERLGANGAELRRFARNYSVRLEPVRGTSQHVDEGSWTTAIGQHSASRALREYFLRAVAETGVDDALRSHLPDLLPGVGGAGFHGVIRLAYAIESAVPEQVAAGLAYFAEVARPLGEPPEGEGSVASIDELFVELSAAGTWSNAPHERLIDDAMRAVAQHENFVAAIQSLSAHALAPQGLLNGALRLYSATEDFTALHAVTGLAALAALRPWVADHDALDRYSAQALTAAFLSIGAPPLWSEDRLEEFAQSSTAPTDVLRLTAAVADDEHDVKVVYTTLSLYAQTGNPLCRALAHRAVADQITGN